MSEERGTRVKDKKGVQGGRIGGRVREEQETDATVREIERLKEQKTMKEKETYMEDRDRRDDGTEEARIYDYWWWDLNIWEIR